ncbi:UNVERIFIED_CONTAM: beta-lactamase family protein, partial [Bacteroidetes bacterium 56_B9]
FQYCNIMFATVGVMLERHTGLQLESLLHDWIWKLLGMKSTTFSVQQAIGSGDLAAGYYWDEDGETYIPEPYYDILPVAGA